MEYHPPNICPKKSSKTNPVSTCRALSCFSSFDSTAHLVPVFHDVIGYQKIHILHTPPKTNMEPKNLGLEYDFAFERVDIFGSILAFEGVHEFSDRILLAMQHAKQTCICHWTDFDHLWPLSKPNKKKSWTCYFSGWNVRQKFTAKNNGNLRGPPRPRKQRLIRGLLRKIKAGYFLGFWWHFWTVLGGSSHFLKGGYFHHLELD